MSTLALRPLPLALAGASLSPANFRYDVALVGAVNGVNLRFSLPGGQKFVHNLGVTIVVHVNGLKQTGGMFTPVETGGLGTGYNAVDFISAPIGGATITADYVTA